LLSGGADGSRVRAVRQPGSGGARSRPATQASANRQYCPKTIALLEQGLPPAEVVTRITDDDPERDARQVAVTDPTGRRHRPSDRVIA